MAKKPNAGTGGSAKPPAVAKPPQGSGKKGGGTPAGKGKGC